MAISNINDCISTIFVLTTIETSWISSIVNMADVKPIGKALFLREEELRRGIELMFFAYRDFTGEADSILAEIWGVLIIVPFILSGATLVLQ